MFKYFVVLIGLSLTSTLAIAGEKVGNGGGAWICRSANGIEKAEVVDLWESKNEFGQTLTPVGQSTLDEIVEQHLLRLQRSLPKFGVPVARAYLQMKEKIRFTDADLTETGDGVYRTKPSASFCQNGVVEFFQAANYTDLGPLLIAKQIWELGSFSNLHRAALLIHEAVYRRMRLEFHDVTSMRTRLIVGALFSTMSEDQLERTLQNVFDYRPGNTCIGSQHYCDWLNRLQAVPEEGVIYQEIQHGWQVTFRREHLDWMIAENVGPIRWPWKNQTIAMDEEQGGWSGDVEMGGTGLGPVTVWAEVNLDGSVTMRQGWDSNSSKFNLKMVPQSPREGNSK